MLMLCAALDELTPRQLLQCLRLRSDVFVVEQACIYPDIDDKDSHCDTRHIALMTDNTSTSSVIAYARCLAPGVSYAQASIGRVVVAPDCRGKGFAQEIMTMSLAYCTKQWPDSGVQIGAQTYLQSFYQTLGFVPNSAPYDEDGIMHLDMLYLP